MSSRTRIVVASGVLIAVAALLLQWLDFRHGVRTLSTEVYVLVVATLFTALGIWAGRRLSGVGAAAPDLEGGGFARNERAIATLGISDREYEVLELLAEGCTNRQIADRLFVSENTVKTHLSNLYGKLQVSRRTQAVRKSRELGLIP